MANVARNTFWNFFSEFWSYSEDVVGLDALIPVYMININILFFFFYHRSSGMIIVPQSFLNPGQLRLIAGLLFSAGKCQHHVADMFYPSPFRWREWRTLAGMRQQMVMMCRRDCWNGGGSSSWSLKFMTSWVFIPVFPKIKAIFRLSVSIEARLTFEP